jgi:hypothetical protein
MLALGVDGVDAVPDERGEPGGLGAHHGPIHEQWAQPGGDPPDRVTLRHGRRVERDLLRGALGSPRVGEPRLAA